MIDAHVHVVHDHPPGEKAGEGSVLDLRADALADEILREMKAAGIAVILGMGRMSAPPDDPLGINGTLRLAALIPGLHAIGAIDPTKTPTEDPGYFQRAEDQLASGKVVGLKAYLGYIHVGPNDPRYVPFYRLARKYKVPVVFHTGDTLSAKAKVRLAHPLPIDDVAVDHPEVNFVLAHFGNPWLLDAAELVYKNENVWADLSGLVVGEEAVFRADDQGNPPADSGWALFQKDFHKAYRFVDKPERFLYGSDWPLAPMDGYRRFVESFIPKEHRELVFESNARALFKIK